MCGRFTLTAELSELQRAFPWTEFPAEIVPRYNIAPSQPVAVIASHNPKKVDFFLWGLIPHWAKDPQIGYRLINARAETLTQKPTFRVPYRYRRCLILADGFFEWQKEGKSKKPFLFRFKNGKPFAMAGLWDRWQSPDGSEILSCTIITTEANDLVKPIHERMPVILPSNDLQYWLEASEAELARLNSLLQPYPPTELEAFAVSPIVNNPRQDRPECIQPA